MGQLSVEFVNQQMNIATIRNVNKHAVVLSDHIGSSGSGIYAWYPKFLATLESELAHLEW